MSTETDQLEAEIEAKRERLGATVDELSERLDVKKQAQEKVAETKAQVSTLAGRREVRAGAAATVAAGLLVAAVKTYRD